MDQINMELVESREYTYQAKEGTRVEVKIEAKIKEFHKNDINEIHSKFITCTHNFYINLLSKIIKDPKFHSADEKQSDVKVMEPGTSIDLDENRLKREFVPEDSNGECSHFYFTKQELPYKKTRTLNIIVSLIALVIAVIALIN